MKNKILFCSLLVSLAWLSGCTVNKALEERLRKIEERLDAIEKMLAPPKEEPQEQSEAYNIPIGTSYVLHGKDSATKEGKAHVVVFSNFQCPYCAQADTALRQLLDDPKLKDRIDVVFKHFPFPRHPFARPASKAALAAGEQGNDKFWAMVDKLFKNQDALSEANFVKWAKELKLDIPKFQKDLKDNDKKYDDIINEDIKLGENAAKLQGTPWILVDGWVLTKGITAADIEEKLNKRMKDEKHEHDKHDKI